MITFERYDLVRFGAFKGRILAFDSYAHTFHVRCMDGTTQDVPIGKLAKILPPLALPKTKR